MVNKWNAINQEEKRKEEKFARTLDPEYKQMKQKQQTKEFITASLARFLIIFLLVIVPFIIIIVIISIIIMVIIFKNYFTAVCRIPVSI